VTFQLQQGLQAAIFAQMEATYPNEGGGFLLGQHQPGGTVIIEDLVQVENVFETEEQYHRYAMTPHNWMQIEDLADERGLTLVGYYHSHPDAPSIPSEYDRVHALPNFAYLITSVRSGQAVGMQGWQLHADRTRFFEVSLVVR
jgi:proteasome lid subunit RPN8/RPN11